jgi:peroxiredoxin
MLLFYPGDETSACTKQFCAYRDNARTWIPSASRRQQ